MINNNESWEKNSVQNSEYAIMRTFEDIAKNIEKNIESMKYV